MKAKYMLMIILAAALSLSACAKPAEEPAPTPTPTPTVRPTPKEPTRTPGVAYDYSNFFVQCEVDWSRRDVKSTWKVYKPTESPDPDWGIELIDGDIVTYYEIECNHVSTTPVPTDEPAEDSAGDSAETPAGE